MPAIKIRFSNRLRKSLGKTHLKKRLILLHPELEGSSSSLLGEVLCHELAHIANYEINGEFDRPHGHAWRSLVTAAGYTPKTKLAVYNLNSRTRQVEKKFVHRCPVCFSKRISRRKMKNWRCANCLENGLSGKIVVDEA